MKIWILSVLAACCLMCGCRTDKGTCFALVADTHINSNSSANSEGLLTIIRDINSRDSIDFVILAGDITEFGSDREIELARELLDSLEKPWYILSGNHDSKWSESGCNTFLETFGYEQFYFVHNHIAYIGTNSGPNMRMAPALVPRESLVWLDSVLRTIPARMPVVYVNHYPLTEDMSNYRKVIELLSTRNIQLALCGHYHTNEAFTTLGIPAVKSRTALPGRTGGRGYNLVNIHKGQVTFRERIVREQADSSYTLPAWHSLTFTKGPSRIADTLAAADKQQPDPGAADQNVEVVWSWQDESDIGSAAVADTLAGIVVFANTKGIVKAVALEDGKALWSTPTKGKIFSTPAINKDRVFIGSTDKNVYCLDLHNGQIIWTYPAGKSIVASPAVMDGIVYIGGSDGTFRALDAESGSLLWEYTHINGFMESRPYADSSQVVAGSWGNELYSFHPRTGVVQWVWENRHRGRGYSPAATWPVKANGKIFITTPERKCYAIDARTGKTVWEAGGGRESIGLSVDGQQVYVKTMFDSLYAFQTAPRKAVSQWRVAGGFGYEIGPSPVTEQDDLVFVPSATGSLYAYHRQDGSKAWQVLLSDGLVNYAQPTGHSRLVVSTMDGRVLLISYKKDGPR